MYLLRSFDSFVCSAFVLATLSLSSTNSHAQQTSTLCHFLTGPLAGETQDYAPLRALPIASSCHDGHGSFGVIVAGQASARWELAGIDYKNLPQDPGGQDTPVTCWAASIAYIFAYYQHQVPQDVIAKRYFPSAPSTAKPTQMAAALNTSWIDSDGSRFRVSSVFTDSYSGLAKEITNQDVVDALVHEKPVFFANTHHAMVLLTVKYQNRSTVPLIESGEVWDPDPQYHKNGRNGIRPIRGSELHALFAAIPKVN